MTSERSVYLKEVSPDIARIGAYALESLTTGMYTDPLDALREYIQNALDGVTEAENLGLISRGRGVVEIFVDRSARRLAVRDNGAGISPTRAFEVLTSVGMSRKDLERFAGFRGIGRLAGIAYCSNLLFRSSQAGIPRTATVWFDCVALRKSLAPNATAEDLSQVIRRCVRHQEEAARIEDHFFEVVLDEMIDGPSAMLDSRELQNYLCQRAPVDFDAQTWPYHDTILDYIDETKNQVPTLELIIRDELGESFPILKPYKTFYKTERKDDCRITSVTFIPADTSGSGWWGWFGNSDLPGAITDKNSAGIRFRMKNIQIGDRTVMDEIFRSISESYVRFNGWYIGEIHINDPDVVPNGRRDGFEDTPAWRRIRSELEILIRELSTKCYHQSQDRRKSVQKIEREVERTIEAVEDKLQEGLRSREQRDHAKEDVAKRRSRVELALKASRPDHERKRIEASIERLKAVEQQLDAVESFGTDSALSRLDRKQRMILRIVFDVLDQLLDQPTFEKVQKTIMDRLLAGARDKR